MLLKPLSPGLTIKLETPLYLITLIKGSSWNYLCYFVLENSDISDTAFSDCSTILRLMSGGTNNQHYLRFLSQGKYNIAFYTLNPHFSKPKMQDTYNVWPYMRSKPWIDCPVQDKCSHVLINFWYPGDWYKSLVDRARTITARMNGYQFQWLLCCPDN